MGTVLSSALLMGLGFASCGGGSTQVRSLGDVKLSALCEDPKRCEVKGDAYTNVLKDADGPRLYLAGGQGPEQYLGKVAPGRKPGGALTTCGTGIEAGDWLETAPALRVVKLGAQGKARLRSTLRAHLVKTLSAHSIMREQGADMTLQTTVDTVLSQIVLKDVTVYSETYWLTDLAFEERIGLCGEENYEDIIYSLTVLELSPMFQRDVEMSLKRAIARVLNVAPAQSVVPPTNLVPAVTEPSAESPAAKQPIANEKVKQAAPPNVPEPHKTEEGKVSAARPVAAVKPRKRARKRKVGAAAPAHEEVTAAPFSTPTAPMAPASSAPSPPVAAQPLSAPEACPGCADVAHATMQSLADDTRLVTAMGFDDRE